MISEPAPIIHSVRYEFGAVIEAHVMWRAMYELEAVQHGDDTVGIDVR